MFVFLVSLSTSYKLRSSQARAQASSMLSLQTSETTSMVAMSDSMARATTMVSSA